MDHSSPMEGKPHQYKESIMNLDSETGISIMKIVEELDSGPVGNIYKIKLDYEKNAEEISERLSLLAADKIIDNIDGILEIKLNLLIRITQKLHTQKK